MGPILEIEDLHKSFGGLKALDGASLVVERGSITGLIGPNGSGKTTLFNCATGFYNLDMGEVFFGEECITGLSPDAIARKGMVRTFQTIRIFPHMTVMENMLSGPMEQTGETIFRRTTQFLTSIPRLLTALPRLRSPEPERIAGWTREETEHARKAFQLLEFLEIDHLWNEYASNLSGGQQKLLILGRSLMSDPSLVMLDEPIAGVNPILARKIFERTLELRKEKKQTFFIIEHNVGVLFRYCEHIYVMDEGQVVAEGTPDEIQQSQRVIEAYLGR